MQENRAIDRHAIPPGAPAPSRDRGEVRLEQWRPGSAEGELLALRARVWGSDHPHNQPEFYRWLFGDGNPSGRGGGVILRRGDRVLGFMGLCPRLARFEGRDVRIAHCVDYMVDRDLSAAISARYAVRIAKEWSRSARAEGFAFGIGYPNENSRRLVTSPRIGWIGIFSPKLMVRPLRGAWNGARHGVALTRLGLSLAGGVLDVPARLTRRPEGAARPLLLSRSDDAAAVDALWMRLRDGGRVSLGRDAATLRWRYESHPLRQYRLLSWEGNDGLSALIVTTRRALNGLPSLLIVDALVDPAAPAAARALIGEALREARGAGGASLAAAETKPGTALARALMSSGFVAVPRRLDPKPFTLVGLPLAESDYAFRADWEFAWGDMDVV